MLDAVNDNRSIEIDHIDDPLGSQKVRAPEQEQRFEPEIERIAMDRLIDREAERLDVSVMAIDVVVLVGVAVAGRSVFMIVRLGIGLRLEPVLHVEALGLRVVKTGIEQRCRIYDAVFCNDLRSCGVQAPQTVLQSAQDIEVDEIGLG